MFFVTFVTFFTHDLTPRTTTTTKLLLGPLNVDRGQKAVSNQYLCMLHLPHTLYFKLISCLRIDLAEELFSTKPLNLQQTSDGVQQGLIVQADVQLEHTLHT